MERGTRKPAGGSSSRAGACEGNRSRHRGGGSAAAGGRGGRLLSYKHGWPILLAVVPPARQRFFRQQRGLVGLPADLLDRDPAVSHYQRCGRPVPLRKKEMRKKKTNMRSPRLARGRRSRTRRMARRMRVRVWSVAKLRKLPEAVG
ncbi:MAG: hypothetical protein BJ554DRAFT_4256 [Olpidium bornovanus]|uniref:Uncharacterized protein n=1 Tax=Olpidium bornovanus TaxID=278681 RepID=A0A8H7ZN04_9FUNG|nr:MAG: hypothetical protein BJ554DRAFT_4256 [Olpidium bornovanus]